MNVELPSRVHRVSVARARHGDVIDRLVPYLQREDPAADRAVDALARRDPQNRERVIDAICRGETLDDASLQALAHDVAHVPPWVCWDRIERAGSLFRRSGAVGGIVLGVRSLVYGYAAPAGNKPLVMTGRLAQQASRRLAETGNFVRAVCAPGGLPPGRDGHRITVRVRLMHAQVRRLLRARGDWRPEQWGAPINQHDMLSTLMLFSTVFTEGVEMLGIRVTDREKDDYVHLWRTVGWFMGVDPVLLPADEAEARRIAEVILLTQGPPDDDSRALVRALLRGPLTVPEGAPPWRRALARGHHDFASGLCRFLVGEETADGLDLPRDGWRWSGRLLRTLIGPADRVGAAVPGLRARAEAAGTAYWERSVALGLGPTPARYSVPDRLRSSPGST